MSVAANPEKLKKFLNKRVSLKINHGREVVIEIQRKVFFIGAMNSGGGDHYRL